LVCATTGAQAAKTILVFGDSLSAGYGIRPEAAWPSLLDKRLQEKHLDYSVANASISGETTSGGRSRLDAAGIDWRGGTIEGRYLGVSAIQRAVTTELATTGENFSDRLDRVLTHKVWGTLIFLAIMTLMFQSIFTFARIPMDALQTGVDWLGHAIGSLIPPGDLNS